MRSYRYRLLIIPLVLVSWTVLARAQTTRPYRFLVMGDPQFMLAKPGDKTAIDGYRWTSTTWARMPVLSERIGASFFFVCGDLFGYTNGDGSTIPALWDNWDKYTQAFRNTRIEWVTGGHEFWGGSPNDAQAIPIFKKRYPDRIRYAINDNDNLFILFDDIHDPKSLDPSGLQWLATTLEASRAKRTFFFGHVPPRNTAAWWPDGSTTKPDDFRSKMAALLEKHRITAAFFGHEHIESYISDTGGFPMFSVGVAMPLLVEIDGGTVKYRWLKKPLMEDPLAQSSEAFYDRPLEKWRVAVLPSGRKPAVAPTAIDPAKPLRLDDDSEVPLQDIAAEDGVVSLPRIANIHAGDKVIAIGEIPKDGLWSRHVRFRSRMPAHIYHNTTDLGDIAPSQRWNAWLVGRDSKGRNWVTLDLDVTDTNASFSLIPQTNP